MKSRNILLATLLVPATLTALVACGGDDDEDLALAENGLGSSTTELLGVPASGPANTGVDGTVPVGIGEDCDTKCTTSVVIHVTNNSSRTLDFSGNDSNTPENVHNQKPKAKLLPGDMDSFEIKTSIASGVLYQPVWVVEGTGDRVASFFQVPTIGANTVSCAGDAFTPGSQYVRTKCSMEHGYHPNAQLTFTDK
jgi:hypothetical protein